MVYLNSYIRALGNRKRTWSNKLRKIAKVYLIFHPLIQQEEIQKVAKKDHEINLLENVPIKLNIKAYVMMVKKEEVLN